MQTAAAAHVKNFERLIQLLIENKCSANVSGCYNCGVT